VTPSCCSSAPAEADPWNLFQYPSQASQLGDVVRDASGAPSACHAHSRTWRRYQKGKDRRLACGLVGHRANAKSVSWQILIEPSLRLMIKISALIIRFLLKRPAITTIKNICVKRPSSEYYYNQGEKDAHRCSIRPGVR
jgi:hypothetical protein